jgi:hypothetical protein
VLALEKIFRLMVAISDLEVESIELDHFIGVILTEFPKQFQLKNRF